MAYREVDPGPAPEAGEFVSFKAIGEKFIGRFIGVTEITNSFSKKQNQYTFKNKEGIKKLDANYDLDRRLKAADLKPGITLCLITYIKDADQPDPTRSAMKLFKLLVDDSPPGAKAAAAPPPPPPSADSDIDF